MEQPSSSIASGAEKSKDLSQDPLKKSRPAGSELRPSMRLNSLRQAMASADLRLALEYVDSEEAASRTRDDEADQFAQSLEAELEGNFQLPQEWETERDEQTIERVNSDLRKACSEIAREAQVSLRIEQLVRERDRELRILDSADDEIVQPVADDNGRGEPYRAAISKRRMLMFCVAAALVGGGSVLYGVPTFTDRLSVWSVEEPIQPAVVTGSAATSDRLTGLKFASAASVTETDAGTATDAGWQNNLSGRLRQEQTEPVVSERPVEPIPEIVEPLDAGPVATDKPEPVTVPEKAAPEKPVVKELARLDPDPPGPEVSEPVVREAATNGASREVKPVTEPEKQPRSPQSVELALASSHGLEGLPEAQRQNLKGMLVEGECLSTALRTIFVKVPVLAMRDLVLKLESEC